VIPLHPIKAVWPEKADTEVNTIKNRMGHTVSAWRAIRDAVTAAPVAG